MAYWLLAVAGSPFDEENARRAFGRRALSGLSDYFFIAAFTGSLTALKVSNSTL